MYYVKATYKKNMKQETISISSFRANLRKYCHAVKFGRKELIVTYHREDLFKVVKAPEARFSYEVESSFVRYQMKDFAELIEQKSTIVLILRGKPLVKCDLL
jgi:PHD/YefM family antitoxin component YafN of YafNO toxin-antitoxin module